MRSGDSGGGGDGLWKESLARCLWSLFGGAASDGCGSRQLEAAATWKSLGALESCRLDSRASGCLLLVIMLEVSPIMASSFAF